MSSDFTLESEPDAEDAFWVQLVGHREMLVGFFRQRETKPGFAEDLAHDVLLRAWKYRSRFDPSKGNLGQWLSGIARNQWFDVTKQRGREFELKHPELLPADDRESLLDRPNVERCFSRLSEEEQQLFQLRADGYTYGEINEKTGRTVDALTNAFRKLAEKLVICLSNPVENP